MENKERCAWCLKNSLDQEYHDKEWGVPLHDDQTLFEYLILEGAQAGLSWSTVLAKRENYRKAFDGFNPEIVSEYSEDKVQELMANPGIIRNQLKIRATITNARCFLEMKRKHGSFDKYIWGFVNHQPIINRFAKMSDIPSSTEVSEAMSKQLKKDGFKFVGSTICYAFMQATGMVNDHVTSCYRYTELLE